MVLCWMSLINIVFLQLRAKEGFPVIQVICHGSVIYVTGHVARHKASETFFPPFPPVSYISP